MYELTRSGPNYRNLVVQGVTCLSLEPMDFWKRRWRIKLHKSSLVPREHARLHIKNFLAAEFDATEMDFFLDKNNPDQYIVVVFTTNAL